MNIRTVRKKNKSIRNVRKITKAMQMVSAVKMRKAQQLEVESRPYRDGLTELIAKLIKKVDPSKAKLLQVDVSQAEKRLVIVVSSNKGLAGSFNVNIFRYALSAIQDFKDVELVTVGSKGTQFFGRLQDAHILADFSGSNLIIEASPLFDFVLEQFQTGKFKSISIIYSQFISTMRSQVVEETLLPLTSVEVKEDIKEEGQEKKKFENTDILIEPSPTEILESLLMSFIENKIRGALISSEAVEHSARMMAMKSATDNASDLIYQLTLLSNRLRQEKITYELLDMINAIESVKQ
ncbi:ATP synthase F1 subunit gamma [Candidatus Roizmanbacteria bacterium]|nr:MAG: ATP synthase F1 subunit gamma [Candidatus Roizmanbacteria bacterium]